MKRLLSLATLYPNAHRPRFGPFVAAQLEALAARGDWDITVINPIGVPPVPIGRYRALSRAALTTVERGVTVHRPRFTLLPGIGGRFNPLMIVRAALPLARRLHGSAPFDLVDAQFFYPDGPAAARVAAALGLPLSIKARGADISLWADKGYARRLMLQAADQAAGLLAVSKALAGDMAERGFPADKITVHYTGLDRARFHPRERVSCRAHLTNAFGLELPDGAPLLATVGALIPRKGQSFVLRALVQIPGAHLALVGDGPDKVLLETLGRELGIERRVHFLGSLDHERLPVLLSAADMMVLPSASEGLANAWVEALACGCPLVITAAGGARELLTRPEAGILVERDAGAIAHGIRQMLAAPPPREAVAACAERFSWEANAAELAAYYERLVDQAHA